MGTVPVDKIEDAKASILQSARREIEANGILGLRVAEVAAGANCSITQIYRYFVDRNGLLARVLGDIYEELLQSSSRAYQAKIFGLERLTVDDLVDALPSIFEAGATRNQQMRLQILAVSATNEQLRTRIESITLCESEFWNEGLDEVERRLPPDEKFDRRMFTMFLANLLPYYRFLLGDKGFTAEEFRQFLRDKMSS